MGSFSLVRETLDPSANPPSCFPFPHPGRCGPEPHLGAWLSPPAPPAPQPGLPGLTPHFLCELQTFGEDMSHPQGTCHQVTPSLDLLEP